MGTTGAYAEATEVRRDEPTNVSKLNATAEVLQLPDRLPQSASPQEVEALAKKVKAAVTALTK